MTTKDIILLFVPIIANGLLMFAAQSLLKRWFKRLEDTDKRKSDIVEKFCEMLFDSLEVVSEAEKQFKFREDMESINEKFRITFSELSRYGRNMDFVLHIKDDIEKLRAKCGFCHNRLINYNSLWIKEHSLCPMEEQEEIINYFKEIKSSLQRLCKKCIKL